ncbi:class I SAM-dependent methyltransferase [Streptomyces sp. NPDC088350]|uniref:class I SAM-dependent methyltransferase n=1 Tax=Streptomyces sp. NPDC088350 TaxID=3365854 RepID=UPI003819135F
MRARAPAERSCRLPGPSGPDPRPRIMCAAPHAPQDNEPAAVAPAARHEHARLAELSGARPGDRVLDVGCGTGCLSRRMAKAVGVGSSVLGIDPSVPVVEYARRKTQASQCSYEAGVAEALEAADASFDVVVTSLAVHHLPEEVRPVALREMFRVLRPGGRLLVADFRPPRTRPVRHLVAAITGHVMTNYQVDLLDGLITDTGFEVRGRGDVRPWLRYVQGTRPGKA